MQEQVLREEQGLDLPGVLLTGDTDTERLREARASRYRLLHKPVSPDDLRRAVLEDAVVRPRSPARKPGDDEHKV